MHSVSYLSAERNNAFKRTRQSSSYSYLGEYHLDVPFKAGRALNGTQTQKSLKENSAHPHTVFSIVVEKNEINVEVKALNKLAQATDI